MEKQLIINNEKTNFWIEDTGRLRNERTKRWLKGGVNKGYHFYSIYFKAKQYIFYTHRLVAEYFIPNDNPKEKTIVHHLDGDKLNNIYTNLEWISPKEHNQTIKDLGQTKSERGPQQVISLEDFPNDEIAQFRNTPYYATKQGEIINISKKIKLVLFPSGNYYRFNAAYGLNKKFLVHRVVWEAFNGPIPEGYDVDHIDGNPKNNKLENLRLLTHRENLQVRNMNYDYAKDNFYYGE